MDEAPESRTRAWIELTHAVAAIITAVAVIVGIVIFFIVERPDARHNAQIASTLRYIALFQDGIVERSRTALSRSWFDQEENLRLLRSANATPPAVMQRLAEIVVENSPSDGSEADLRFAVFRVAEYFDNVLLCVEKEICDAETADDYFAPFAERFYCLYRPVIDNFQENIQISQFGDGLRRFAQGNPSCEF